MVQSASVPAALWVSLGCEKATGEYLDGKTTHCLVVSLGCEKATGEHLDRKTTHCLVAHYFDV